MGLGGISKKEDGKVWVDANFLFSLSLYYFFLKFSFLIIERFLSCCTFVVKLCSLEPTNPFGRA